MTTKACECGCGTQLVPVNVRGRYRRFVAGHQNRHPSEKQKQHHRKLSQMRRGQSPWNVGRNYVIAKRTEYANRSAWMKALKRVFGDKCMRCGWSEAPCDGHHIVPKGKGGKHSLANGIVLCPNCHRMVETGKIDLAAIMAIRSSAIELVPFF